MKVILDTNVIISGIFFSGPPYQILKAWKDGKMELVLSEEIYNEYKRVAKFISLKYEKIDISEILNLIAINAEFFEQIKLPRNICEDPDDVKFIACALSSNTKIIVSGDKHLLKLPGYEGIEIIKPGEFIKKYL